MTSRKKVFIFIILLTAPGWHARVWADGLSTTYVDVMVQQVPLGRERAISDGEGRPLVLKNLSDHAIEVHLDALVPTKTQLQGTAEAIPDTRWITIAPQTVTIPAKGKRSCKVTVRVPENPLYRGKFYQAVIWSHATPPKAGGVTFNAGLISRLRFTTKK